MEYETRPIYDKEDDYYKLDSIQSLIFIGITCLLIVFCLYLIHYFWNLPRVENVFSNRPRNRHTFDYFDAIILTTLFLIGLIALLKHQTANLFSYHQNEIYIFETDIYNYEWIDNEDKYDESYHIWLTDSPWGAHQKFYLDNNEYDIPIRSHSRFQFEVMPYTKEIINIIKIDSKPHLPTQKIPSMEILTPNASAEILQQNLQHTVTSWSKQAGLNPINVKYGKGVYFYDQSDKRYIDFTSQLMNVNIGHGDPRVTEAVIRQMEQISFVNPGMVTEARGILGQKLADIAPGTLNRTFFTNGGTEAVEHAIKFARLYTGRHKIITFYQSYHGATYGALSAGGDPRGLPHDSQGVPNIIHVENPYYYRCPWNSKSIEECCDSAIAHLERIIKYEGPQNIAALLMEGESGSSGCIKYPPNYWKRAAEICQKYGILTIADEVMSGFGRTGKWFVVDHHDVVPDLMCLAKGLTSGYIPLGGVMFKEEIIQAFNDKPLPLGLTYSAHSVACASANAVLDIYESDNLVENAAEMGRYMDESVAKLAEKHPSIGDFRNTGLLGCIELVKNRESKEPITPWNAAPHEMETTNKIAAKLNELGLFTFVRWNWIFTAPPLCVTKDEIDEGLSIISEALKIADEVCD